MSDIDPTPDTPTTLGDRLAWFRGDVAARLIAIAGNPASNLGALAAQLAAILGTPAKSISDIWTHTAEVYRQLAGGQGITLYNLIDNLHTQLADTNNRIDTIQAVLGAGPYSSTETANIRAILLEILNSDSRFGIAPDGSSGTVSNGTTSTGGYRYILWSSISGVTIAEGYKVTATNGWGGYEVYVQTDAPSFEVVNLTANTVASCPANSWTVLGGTGQLAFRVSSGYNARGYMRTPNSSWYYSQYLTALTAPVVSYNMIVWPAAMGGSVNSTLGVNRYGQTVYLYKNMKGYRLRIISGGNANADLYTSSQNVTTVQVTTSTYTVLVDTVCFVVYSAAGGFTIEVLPPV